MMMIGEEQRKGVVVYFLPVFDAFLAVFVASSFYMICMMRNATCVKGQSFF
jgi:hypothetical protein